MGAAMSDWDEWRKGDWTPSKSKRRKPGPRPKYTKKERTQRMRWAGMAQSRARTDLTQRYPKEYRELYLMHKAQLEADYGVD